MYFRDFRERGGVYDFLFDFLNNKDLPGIHCLMKNHEGKNLAREEQMFALNSRSLFRRKAK